MTTQGDGCSGAMSWAYRRAFGKPPPWEGCCDRHDEAYRKGGPASARRAADAQLRACVRARGHPWVAWAMFWGVRALGGRHAPPLHRLVAWAPRLGLAESVPDYRWGRVPPAAAPRDEKFEAWLAQLERHVKAVWGRVPQGYIEGARPEWRGYYDDGFSPSAAFEEDQANGER